MGFQESFVVPRCPIRGDGEDASLVVLVHLSRFVRPVRMGILEYAETVNPNVLKA
jgi:hypothetical protein